MLGNALKRNEINIARVAMPVIETLMAEGLSWSNREKCADALRAVLRHHKSLMDEQLQSAIGGAEQGQLPQCNSIRNLIP